MLPIVAGGLVLVSGCVVEPNGAVAFQPLVVAPAPVEVDSGPAPEVDVSVDVVPETYVWDGYENVGIVGGQYYYLGPGNVWIVCDHDRFARFDGWERGHPDWREHMVRNDRFRNDAHGHFHAMGEGDRRSDIEHRDQARDAHQDNRGEKIEQRDQTRDAHQAQQAGDVQKREQTRDAYQQNRGEKIQQRDQTRDAHQKAKEKDKDQGGTPH